MNCKNQKTPDHPKTKPLRQTTEVDLTSQAWEATSPEKPEQKRVSSEEVRKNVIAQGTDKPSIPGGRNPDTAMCEDRDHPGRIDKENDY